MAVDHVWGQVGRWGRPMETHLRWFVPGAARVSAPRGRVALQDDRLVSAALVAVVDGLIRDGKIKVGRAKSVINPGYDPLDHLPDY